ncbi:MAG: hypothetical protein GX414_07730 [Acidobacteria bacterium]|nr:hypothetical protein [Acidobacteriota bacterium]
MAIREGAWDCPMCGRARNRGPDRYCGGCGAPRGAEVRMYLPDDAREVVDETEVAKAKAGPDWTCAFCGGDNPGANAFCSGCGAGADAGRSRLAPPPAPPAAPLPATGTTGRKVAKGCLIAAAAFVLVAVAGLYWFCRPRSTVLVADGFHWERSIQTQQLRTFTEQGWEGELPKGIRVLRQERAVHHQEKVQTGTREREESYTEQVKTGTERVKVGTRDLGNGYFEDVYEDRPVYESVTRTRTGQEPVYKERPVYKTRYTYTVDRWVDVKLLEAAGDNQRPMWPAFVAGAKDRAGTRIEKYTIRFRDSGGRTYTYEPKTEAEWRSFRPGGRYNADVNYSGILRIRKAEKSP